MDFTFIISFGIFLLIIIISLPYVAKLLDKFIDLIVAALNEK